MPHGLAHATIAPYGPYPTRDGTVVIAVQNEREFLRFVDEVLRLPDLGQDPRFASNSDRVAHRAPLDGQIGANLRGPFYVARAFLPGMREAGRGAFITVGSIADHVAFPENAAYAASKFGLRGLHETLIAEYRGSGVRLTLVSPGPTDTSVWDPVNPDAREGFIHRAGMLRPDDVAEAVVFAASRPPHVHVDWLRINPLL